MHRLLTVLLLVLFSTSASAALERRGHFGLRVMPLSEANAERLGLDSTRGAWIQMLSGASPVRSAGLAIDDVIVEVNGVTVDDIGDFISIASSAKGGDELTVKALRRGRRVSASFEIPPAPLERGDGLVHTYGEFESGGRALRTIHSRSAVTGEHPDDTAVLLIQPHDDGSVEAGGYCLTREVAHALARGGYRAVRYDRPGVGDSEGPSFRGGGFDDDVRDAIAAVESLDVPQLFLLALGTGSLVAAEVARRVSVSGVVMFEAPGRPWVESVPSRARRELDAQDVPAGDIAEITRAAATIAVRLADGSTIDELVGRHPAWMALVADASGYPFGRGETFHREVAALDVPHVYAEVGCPLLLTHAEFSLRQRSDDARGIEQTVLAARHEDFVRYEVPNIDHAWVHAESVGSNLERWRDGLIVFDEAAFEPLLGWLDRRANRDSRRSAAGEAG